MGASKYLPHYKSSHGKLILGLYIFYSNWSSRVVNLRGLDKYGSKHTGIQTNIQTNIGLTYEQIITDRLYIREGTVGLYIWEGKDMRILHSNDKTYLWYNLIL